nr:secreted phosphoprotein 24 isoform X1 [Macaca nemestrina]
MRIDCRVGSGPSFIPSFSLLSLDLFSSCLFKNAVCMSSPGPHAVSPPAPDTALLCSHFTAVPSSRPPLVLLDLTAALDVDDHSFFLETFWPLRFGPLSGQDFLLFTDWLLPAALETTMFPRISTLAFLLLMAFPLLGDAKHPQGFDTQLSGDSSPSPPHCSSSLDSKLESTAACQTPSSGYSIPPSKCDSSLGESLFPLSPTHLPRAPRPEADASQTSSPPHPVGHRGPLILPPKCFTDLSLRAVGSSSNCISSLLCSAFSWWLCVVALKGTCALSSESFYHESGTLLCRRMGMSSLGVCASAVLVHTPGSVLPVCPQPCVPLLSPESHGRASHS